jgi:hypothetical protein
MVIDDKTAFVKSLNWDTKNLTETRDYAVVTDHPHEVKEFCNVSRPTGSVNPSIQHRSRT